MPFRSLVFSAFLVALGICGLPAEVLGQASGDTVAPASSDSQPAGSDSVLRGKASGATADSGRSGIVGDSGATRDSSKASSDTASVKTLGNPKPGTAVVGPAPSDSVLLVACTGVAGTGGVARDLLVVVFAPEAGRAQRAAVAKSVKGRLVGTVTSEPGAYYLRVPSGGNEYRLRVVADQLIRSEIVRRVGSRTCPPLPPADTAHQHPS